MRTPRIAILVLFLVASLFVICRSITSYTRANATPYPAKRKSHKSVMGFMYYNTPFSLFPPNAAISLTDDNSTSFAARPAAFGPKLAANGLSGELWVGTGFPEDALAENGELGCSDIVGWERRNMRNSLKNSFKAAPRGADAATTSRNSKRGNSLLDPDNRSAIAKARPSFEQDPAVVNDGTDNYLHAGLAGTGRDTTASASHADIQSLQEAAEIQGKVVLLMRGGCGFLEKVMWAQRRGAIAVIVGDNQKGGPLIQMFAHGDEVENVTIPSVFTARTAAHLLSSLTQPGSFIEGGVDADGYPTLKVQQGSRTKSKSKPKGTKGQNGGRGGTPKSTASHKSNPAPSKSKRSQAGLPRRPVPATNRSWFTSLFGSQVHNTHPIDPSSRPPSSGRLDWVVKEDSGDDKGAAVNELRSIKSRAINKRSTSASASFDYSKAMTQSEIEEVVKTAISSGIPKNKVRELISKLARDDEDASAMAARMVDSYEDDEEGPGGPDEPDSEPHNGLWVTITPTSSASPFFDTLLVLVISPLVTLTVVYALLILRARIRRRRWRAPKSVVDRPTARTYHTVAPSPSISPVRSPRVPSPSSASPTTPLLQESSSASRPRSINGLDSGNFLGPSSAMPTPQPASRSAPREHEKGSSGFSAEWRKYMGRQVECVVCLEEYVDGVSRVMSLPCGHEFHVDCITPWLTTRRRTCPICKGDVVKSLAHGSSSGPRYEPYHDDSDDEPDAEASGARSDDDSDLEHGIIPSEPQDARRSNFQDNWLRLFSSSVGSRARSPSPSPEERDR